jgi:hypothetical protein
MNQASPLRFGSNFKSRIMRQALLFNLLVSLFCWAPTGLAQGPVAPGTPSPHGASPGGQNMEFERAQMESFADPTLPAGTLIVQILGEDSAPLKDVLVQVVQQFQSVARGNESTVLKKQSSADGTAQFPNLETAMRFSYSATVVRDGAEYVVPAFRFGTTGHRLRIPTYPVTSDPRKVGIGMRGFNHVQLRADVLQVDVMYRVINMGTSTWLPQAVNLALPEGAKAIDVGENPGSSGFKKQGESVTLMGSYPPGQTDVQFSFQLENSNTETRSITLGVLPHTAELRVLSELTPDLSLSVSPGFEATQTADGPSGKQVLITRRLMKPGEEALKEVTITLSGLPVTGPGRWYAIAIALIILSVALVGISKGRSGDEVDEEKKRARKTLLTEIVVLERAFQDGIVGPRTFEQTKREILSALARLESLPNG